MANYEATRYDFDGANLTGIEGTATGTILPWTTTTAPSGFLECNGAAVSRSTYSALFAVISTTYGAGDGSTTFNVPDLRDNVAIGRSPGKAIASTGGANTVTSTGNISGSTANATLSTPQLASHAHEMFGPRPPGHPSGDRALSPTTYQSPPLPTVATTSTGGDSGHSHNMSANFSGTANSVVQPYLALMYIIKT